MKRVRLGRTNLNVSDIALGTGAIGSRFDDETSIRILDCYVGEGGNFLDTANVYGRWNPGNKPLSEILIGKWLKAHHLREHLIIATKGCADHQNAIGQRRVSRESILEDINNSLSNLGTDYIDLYYLHQDDPKIAISELLDTLNEIKQDGKIRYFGCSNWSAERIRKADQYAASHGIMSFSANEIMFNLAKANDDAVEEATQSHMSAQMFHDHMETQRPVTAYTSQAAGYFALCREEDFLTNPRFAFPRDFFHNDISASRADRVRNLCLLKGYTPLEITLGFLLAQPFQVIPIVGPWNEKELMESLKASNVTLSDTELNYILDGAEF